MHLFSGNFWGEDGEERGKTGYPVPLKKKIESESLGESNICSVVVAAAGTKLQANDVCTFFLENFLSPSPLFSLGAVAKLLQDEFAAAKPVQVGNLVEKEEEDGCPS